MIKSLIDCVVGLLLMLCIDSSCFFDRFLVLAPHRDFIFYSRFSADSIRHRKYQGKSA